MEKAILDISWSAILKIVFTAFIFYLLFLVGDILSLLFLGLIISLLISPVINFLKRFGLPRALITLFVYLAIFSFFGLFLYWLIPPFVSEIRQFSQFFPQYFQKFSPFFQELGLKVFENFEGFLKDLQENLLKASTGIFSALGLIFGGISSTIFVLTIAFFLSLEEKGAERAILLFSPKKYQAIILDLWSESQKKIALWFGLKILTSFFVGILTGLSCYLFNIQYPIFFGFLAGILNLIPIVGPILTGIVLFLFAVFDSLLKAVFILIVFTLIQQIEGIIIVPILAEKIIGLPPVLVLISLMIGGKLWGVLGAILVIPLAGIFFDFLKKILLKSQEKEMI